MIADDRLITRCPHCDTAFRVYEHQLMKREGQVRCGACGNVFNAYDTLDDVEPGARDPLTIDGPPSLLPRQTDVPVGTPQAVHSVDIPVEAEDDRGERRRARHEEPEGLGRERRSREDAYEAAYPDGPLAEAENASDYLSADGDDYDFGPREPSGKVRVLYAVGAGLLVLLLFAQVLVWFRDELAGRMPALAPTLAALCAPVGCAVGLPRHAENILIESSELQTEPSGLLMLTATLRNRAGYLQAQPLLELTLTDAREQPIVRKVLQPADYLEPAALGTGSLPAAGDLVARAYLDITGVTASGYRLLVFYP